MNEKIVKQFLSKLSEANSNDDIDRILDEIVPQLRTAGISIQQILLYFKMHGEGAVPKSQDHRNSISNSNKAQLVLQKLLAKLGK